MKKWIPLLLALFFILGVSAVLSLNLFGSCDYVNNHLKPENELICSTDSMITANVIAKVSNPEFKSVSEVMIFRDQLQENEQTDSVFMALPAGILRDVTNVLLNKYGMATKLTIVNEYLDNQSVYNNLSPKQQLSNENVGEVKIRNDTSITKELEHRVELSEVDTIINGQKAKIKKAIVYE